MAKLSKFREDNKIEEDESLFAVKTYKFESTSQDELRLLRSEITFLRELR